MTSPIKLSALTAASVVNNTDLIYIDQAGVSKKATVSLLPSSSGGMSIGGSVTSGTARSVLYLDASHALAQDSSNLNWDYTNKRLCIGNSSMTASLGVVDQGTAATFQATKNVTDPSVGFYVVGVNGSVLGTANNTQNAYCMNFSMASDATNAYNVGSLFGIQGFTFHYGGGIMASGYGAKVGVRLTGSGNMTTMVGLQVANGITTGSTGSVTTAYGIQLSDNFNLGSGTITTNYGIYIPAITAGVTNYALYIASGTTASQGIWLGSDVTIYRTGSSAVKMTASVTALNYVATDTSVLGPELYVGSNAAADPNGTETNASTGWVGSTMTVASTSADKYAGTYSIYGSSPATSGSYIYYSFPTGIGNQYTVTFWAKRGATGATQYAGFYAMTGYSNALLTSSWAQYTFTVTATGNYAYLRFYGGADANADLYVDNISIKQVVGGNMTASGYVNCNGINMGFRNLSVNTTLGVYDCTVNCTQPITVTLPNAQSTPMGQMYNIKNSTNGLLVTVATTSSQTIDGLTTYPMADQYQSVTVMNDGNNWIIV